jgi:hypothetical protein
MAREYSEIADFWVSIQLLVEILIKRISIQDYSQAIGNLENLNLEKEIIGLTRVLQASRSVDSSPFPLWNMVEELHFCDASQLRTGICLS